MIFLKDFKELLGRRRAVVFVEVIYPFFDVGW